MALEYQKERSHEINVLLQKFNNRFELYQTNAVFVNCIRNLLKGASVYEILEQVIVMQQEQQKYYSDIISSGTLRQEIVVSKERFEELEKELKTK